MQHGAHKPEPDEKCVDEREVNYGPDARRKDIKTMLMIGALILNFLVVIWKGGQISNQFETLLKTVSMMQTQMSSVLDNMSQARTERLVQSERISNLVNSVNKQEQRIERVERIERANGTRGQ